jgi:hypothetical protein
MIGKILPISSQLTSSVHGELEQNNRHPSHQKSMSDENKKDESHDANLDVSQVELTAWVNELNVLECYVKNNLKFTFWIGRQHTFVCLVDKNGHTLHEYLPIQFKNLYIQLKEDKAESKKGTILNMSC